MEAEHNTIKRGRQNEKSVLFIKHKCFRDKEH